MTDIANTDEYEAWNGASGQRWVLNADRRDRILAPVADALLAAAHIVPGQAVVDIGCGCGVTTLAAAQAVGPAGTVHGLDLSEPMLGVARRRAEASGLSNLTLVQGDAQTYPPPRQFDFAISRFGTMFFADQITAFTNIGRGIRPGGRLCLATWQAFETNDWLTIPFAALPPDASLPNSAADGPGMFAQSDAETVTTTLEAAGYTDVHLEPIRLTFALGADPQEATEYVATTGICRTALDSMPDEQRPAALEAVRAALADHAEGDGVRLGAAIWIITATHQGRQRTS
ncbi:MAG TPA: methyltransferase domain-containing protein [Acidimicrobiales bacterium]|jgi:SAM-dependent methyltransferase